MYIVDKKKRGDKKMIIIVEGVDASGKDTFIDNLVKLTGVKKVRGSSFEISEKGPDAIVEHCKKILNSEEDLIVNRFFYSNGVYGPLYDYPTISVEQFMELHELVNERAILYYIDADTDKIVERINSRGDDMISASEIAEIKANYELMWDLSKPERLIRVDSTDDSLIDIDSPIYGRVVAYNTTLDLMIKEHEEEKE